MASAGTPGEVPNPARRPNVGGGWHATRRGNVGRVLRLEDLAGPCLVQSSRAFDDNGETILDPPAERIGAPISQALHTDHGHRLSVRFLMRLRRSGDIFTSAGRQFVILVMILDIRSGGSMQNQSPDASRK